MARIVMLGGGVCGLAGGLMLARDGHEVTVLERDAAPVPESVDEAWQEWSRDGVMQFRMAHFLQPARSRRAEEELPEVLEALVSAGADAPGPARTDAPQPGRPHPASRR